MARRKKKDEDNGLDKLRQSARELNENPGLVKAARKTRELLPGQSKLADRVAEAPNRPSEIVGRYLAEVEARDSPSTARELGLAAVQVFQALSEAQGRGRGDRDLAILFTDLVEFSAWALDAGDARAVQLLREVGDVVEPAIKGHGGKIVKRLGDGLMAVFTEPTGAVLAAHDAQVQLKSVSVDGYEPRLRAGVHLGRPRKVGGDYLGVDVNIAARVADAAAGNEILVSGVAHDAMDEKLCSFSAARKFEAKGAPEGLDVFEAQVKG